MTTIDHLGYLIADAVRLYPDREALLQDDLTLTYRELDERCDRVASWLVRSGVRRGQRVALWFPNDVRYAECLFGTIRAGAVAVPLNVRQSDEVLAFVLEDSDAVGVLAHPAAGERATRLAGGVRVRFVVGPDELQEAEPSFDPPPHDPGAVCLMPYTSGSTGRPKGVLLTHRGQIWNADVVRRAFLVDETERALLAVPLYHKNAGVTMKVHLIAGGSCVVLPGFDPGAVIEAIERYRVTFLGGVPAMFRMLVNDRETLARHDVSSLRYAVAGSAEVPEDLLDAFGATFGAPIGEGYGLTEGGPDVFLAPRWGIRKRGSVGPPLPGCEVRLVDPEDASREVPVGAVGELWVRNPGVAAGYHKLPEVTAARIVDGWLATGDLMRRDADDYFFFVGRKDDMLNVGGENVYPKEVEEVLLRHPNVQDVAVVPAPHPVKGVVPVAVVVEREPGASTEEDLKGFFLERGPAFAHPRRVVFVASMPLAGTGKLDRAALQSLVAAREGAPR